MPDRRACKATNKAGGPCKAAPLKGKEHCSAHDPHSPAETRFGASEQARVAAAASAEVRRVVSGAQLAREWIELNHHRLVELLDEAIEADRGIVVGNGPSAELEILPDYPTRLAVFKEVHDRAFGKPRQAVEHTGEDGGPIEVSSTFDLKALSVDERRVLLALVEKMADRGPDEE